MKSEKLTAKSQPPTANRKPPTENRQPKTANRKPPTENRQPPTDYRLILREGWERHPFLGFGVDFFIIQMLNLKRKMVTSWDGRGEARLRKDLDLKHGLFLHPKKDIADSPTPKLFFFKIC